MKGRCYDLKKHRFILSSGIHQYSEQKWITASITVEAAFIVPIIIFILFALTYLSFCLYDICRIQNVVDITLHQACLSAKHEADMETGGICYESINERGVFYLLTDNSSTYEIQMKSIIERELSEGMLFMRIDSVNVTVGKLIMDAAVEVSYEIPLPVVGVLFEPYSNITMKGSYPLHDPAETIRQCEVALDTASEVKGVDEIKEKIEKFFRSEK